jgi:hypothetical protein
MTTQTTAIFTPQERKSLRALRARYNQDRDVFSNRELSQLRFLRWLYHNGHFASPLIDTYSYSIRSTP